MRVTFTLSGRDPQEQALMRQLSAAANNRRRAPYAPFPFALLEQAIRAVLAVLERTVGFLVDAVAAVPKSLRRGTG